MLFVIFHIWYYLSNSVLLLFLLNIIQNDDFQEKIDQSSQFRNFNMQLYRNCAPNPTENTKFYPRRPKKKNSNFVKNTENDAFHMYIYKFKRRLCLSRIVAQARRLIFQKSCFLVFGGYYWADTIRWHI